MALVGLDRMNASIRLGAYARKYNYSIFFASPKGLKTNTQDMFMRCETFGFPGQNIATSVDDIRVGPAREHAIGVTYAPLTATFLSTANFWERTYFTEWHELMFDGPKGNKTFRMKYYNNYVTDIDVVQYDDTGKGTYAIRLFDTFPKTIVQQDVALADGELHRMSIEFVFHHWEEIKPEEKALQIKRKDSVAGPGVPISSSPYFTP